MIESNDMPQAPKLGEGDPQLTLAPDKKLPGKRPKPPPRHYEPWEVPMISLADKYKLALKEITRLNTVNAEQALEFEALNSLLREIQEDKEGERQD